VRSNRNNKALGAVEGRLIMGCGEMLVGGEEVLWREMDTSTFRDLTALATIPFSFCQSHGAVSLSLSTCLTPRADGCEGALYDMALNYHAADIFRKGELSHLTILATDGRTSTCQHLRSPHASNKNPAAHAQPTQKGAPPSTANYRLDSDAYGAIGDHHPIPSKWPSRK